MKFQKGFSGHRFLVTGIHQPPYVIKKLSTDGAGNINIGWDGLEIRLLKMIGQRLNFSYEVVEPKRGHAMGYVSSQLRVECGCVCVFMCVFISNAYPFSIARI